MISCSNDKINNWIWRQFLRNIRKLFFFYFYFWSFLYCFRFYIVSMLMQSTLAKFCYCMETRSLIYIANHCAGFYIMTKLNWNELKNLLEFCCTVLERKKKSIKIMFQWKSATTIDLAFCFFMHSLQTHRPIGACVMPTKQ